MPDIRRAPRLARNLALATAAVLVTAAVLTIAVLRPGSHTQTCPGGEDWVIAEPAVALAGAGYQSPAPKAAATAPVPRGTTPRGSADAAGGAAGGTTATSDSATGNPLLLAGCVDTDRLRPVPLSTDGRG
jgi:hypothetical protein